jgi:hypothetical protein
MRTIDVAAVAGPPESSPAMGPAPDSEGSFQTEGRGIVDSSGPGFYVVRRSDGELLTRLERREPCYVLAPRQIGKSSLRVRTQDRLRARGVRCVSVDLTSVGSSASANEWYFSVASAIAEQLGVDTELDAFWNRHRRMSPVRRFRQFLHDVVLDEGGGEEPSPVVVFLDEIDVTLSLPFPRDDFFGLIRSTHEARAEAPAWRRLTFCLIGVAAPLDLVADPERTPFNNSFAVRLDDFTRGEARTFLPGLTRAGEDPQALLDAVLDWTGGHPALTQRLCYWLTRHGPEERALPAKERVDALVRRLFLASGRIDDPILLDAERRFAGDRPDARIPVMLHLYRRLLDGEPVAVDGNNPRQFGLRIAGLAAERQEDGATFLRVRNRIFAAVFNHAWVEEKLARRFLTEPLQIWKDSGRKDDHVLRGGALDIALAWRQGREDVSPDEEEFLHASLTVLNREQRERQQADSERSQRERAEQQVRSQRRIVTILAVSVVLVALSLIAVILLYQKTQQALDEKTRQREAENQANTLIQRATDERVRRLEAELRQAQDDLKAATEKMQAVRDEADAAQADAEAAKRTADEANTRAGKSAYAEWNARKLLTDAKKKADAAAQLNISKMNAENAVATAQQRYEQARKALENSHGASLQPAEGSVASSVAGALDAEQRETARLREQLHQKDAEIATADDEIARLRRIIGEQNDKMDRLSKERDAARQGALTPRFATPPPAPGPPPTDAPGPPGGDPDPYE